MDKEARAIDMLRSISKKGDCFFYATVIKITGDTCSVKIAELELTDVRIKATDDGSTDKLTITPTKNSKVIVGCNNGDLRDLFLVKVDDPEVILYNHGDVKVTIDGKAKEISLEGAKYTLKNSQEDLKTLIEDLIKEIQKITVTTGTGPSGVPINLPQFQQIGLRLPKLFI
jgi:hypothetical protein